MRRLTLTTALVAAFLPAAAFAQTADPAAPQVEVTVPEGFERQEAMVSAEELLGEKVYDVSGESIGEVGDLVFTMTDTENTGGAEPATATGDGTAAATTPATGETATDGATTAPATGDAATAAPEADADTTTAPASDDATATDTATAPAPDDTTATDTTTTPADDATATDGATAPTTGDATAADDTATTTAPATDGGTAMPDTGTADTAATDSGTAGDTAYTAPAPSDSAADTTATTAGDAATAPAATVGEVTHVVLDIGGFLGIGEHRVAVPVSDLAFYRNGDDTRVYLPWSREQLEAIPAYNADDPATWATSTLPAEN